MYMYVRMYMYVYVCLYLYALRRLRQEDFKLKARLAFVVSSISQKKTERASELAQQVKIFATVLDSQVDTS